MTGLTGMHVSLLNSQVERDWDTFVRQCPDASIYHLSGWRHLIENVFGHETYYLISRSERRVEGILPLVRLRSRIFGNYMVSMPYFNKGGAVAWNQQTEEELMTHGSELASGLGVTHVEYRDRNARSGDWPVKKDKVNMVLKLPVSPEELWRKLGAKRRAQIKRPEREGVEVKSGNAELLDDYYEVFARNMRDLGTPVYAKKFFAAILEEFPDEARVTTVYLKNKPVAAGFLLGFRGELEIPWASSLREANPLGVNMLLYWEVLKLAIEKGYRFFNFGRSTPESGTYRFKKQWGAEPVQLYWHYWLRGGGEPPRLRPDNPKFALAIKVWRHLPLSITNWIGPRIVQNLP